MIEPYIDSLIQILHSNPLFFHYIVGNEDAFEEEKMNPEWFPVFDMMSQDAIEEVVNQTFLREGIEFNDKVYLDKFRVWASNDHQLIAWFEALGSVF